MYTHELSIKNLTFECQFRPLFHSINFRVEPGEICQITGANGSGKTTLLRILAGLLEPHSGEVLWQNQSIQTQFSTYKTHIHYLGHQNGFKPTLTIYENLKLHAKLEGRTFCEKIASPILTPLGLDNLLDRLPTHLSAGQVRRLALSKLLLFKKPIWLLDEPITALDHQSQTLFNEWLAQHADNGGLTVIISHQPLTVKNQINSLILGANHA